MLQLKNKKKIYFYIFSLLFLSSILNNNFRYKFSENFLITNIEIDVNTLKLKDKIFNEIEFLLDKNIFRVNKNDILNKFEELNYLENIQIKKNYPSTLRIKARQTDLIAITYINQKKFFLGINGEFIESNKITTESKLPIIFGKFNISEYFMLQKKLIQFDINHNEIIKYFFHKSKRWDLHFENGVLIKLPNKNISEALKVYKEFKIKNEIRPSTIIDLRIKNRIIIKNV